MLDEVTRSVIDHLSAVTADLGGASIEALSLAWDTVLPRDTVAVCLYAIEERSSQRPTIPGVGPDGRPSLSLRLRYAITHEGDHLATQQRLAQVLEALHDHPVVDPSVLRPALDARIDRIALVPSALSSDEQQSLWAAFGRPLRLALYYDIDLASR